jgi:hypothetical protein
MWKGKNCKQQIIKFMSFYSLHLCLFCIVSKQHIYLTDILHFIVKERHLCLFNKCGNSYSESVSVNLGTNMVSAECGTNILSVI